MELGNFIFGNSRGAVSIDRDVFQGDGLFEPLWDALYDLDLGYEKPFDNDVFTIVPYVWNCTCEDTRMDGSHVENCPATKPNFLFKPTGYEIRWYKYPFRDSYANQDLPVEQVIAMVKTCVESLERP